MKLPPYVREYLYFSTERKIVQAAQCAKSRALSKYVETILNIGFFEHQFLILKGVLIYEQVNFFCHHWVRPIVNRQ